MRRPLAFVCSLIVILISVLVYAGILPVNRNLPLPEDGEYVTLTGRVDGIFEKYIVIKANDGLQDIKLLVYIG